ncbi:MAG: GNAT family acetyltransferase [Candidatus Electryoneaceae bacterium]|nr:GNAT family acetyltransferase [Candidatus Electryoneaceae bacterium]
MNSKSPNIRTYEAEDENDVIDIWFRCDLIIPDNNPRADIARKLKVNPDLFLVATIGDRVVATCMAGYEGHRGWINYLAVLPKFQHRGIAIRLMQEAELRLRELGCPKINLQIRAGNTHVVKFYKSVGYIDDDILNMGKRLQDDPPYQR